MSGLQTLAKPYRIKASHRRRGKVASGPIVQRYYDPGIGRFLSVDPVTANSGTGANFNRYWYANNSPYKFIDPDGRCPIAKDGVPCKAELGPGVKISDQNLVKGMSKIAAEIDKPIQVYSGNRDPQSNASVGGVKDSAHTKGNGADVRIPGLSKLQAGRLIFNSRARVDAGIRQVYHRKDNGKLPEHTHLDTKTGPDLQQGPGGVYTPLKMFGPRQSEQKD